MASTDLITGARRDIFVGDIEENRPNSENVNRKLAGNVQFLLDRMVLQERFVYSGFFNNETLYDNGAPGIVRLENDANISYYFMSVRKSGSSSTNQFNIAVYDSAGAFVSNLFSVPPTISGSNGTNVIIGKESIETTATNFQVNNAGHTIDHGTLSLTTLLAGYVLVPFIVENGTNAYHLTFSMKLKEI